MRPSHLPVLPTLVCSVFLGPPAGAAIPMQVPCPGLRSGSRPLPPLPVLLLQTAALVGERSGLVRQA